MSVILTVQNRKGNGEIIERSALAVPQKRNACASGQRHDRQQHGKAPLSGIRHQQQAIPLYGNPLRVTTFAVAAVAVFHGGGVQCGFR